MKDVKLYIENGVVFEAKTNSKKDFTVAGELVFTTSMTGYQETITDPSFAEQIVVMTQPLIGNYGVNKNWNQSNKIYAKGMIVQNIYENGEFEEFLAEQNISLVHSIDTRKLTHSIREFFYPKCVISTVEVNKERLNDLISAVNPNVVEKISTKKTIFVDGIVKNNKKVGVLDFGVKQNIVEKLKLYFQEIYVLPYDTGYNDFVNLKLDAIVLSNGPGDPAVLKNVIKNIQESLGKIEIYGICLGHQLLALALNCQTAIMKFGHRGANHPVLNKQTNNVIITSQNHGYELVKSSLTDDVEITHINLHDDTIEGISSKKYIAKSVQFHPEASPGPNDANIIFQEWFNKFIQ